MTLARLRGDAEGQGEVNPVEDRSSDRAAVARGEEKKFGVPTQLVDLQSREFWFQLLAQLDFCDAKILEHVYESQEGATTLQLMVQHLRHVGLKREALRRRSLALAELGLLQVVSRTRPLCIHGRIELEARIVSLVHGVFERLGVTKR